MELYFFGDTDQRAYTLSGAKMTPTYTYSGALQIFDKIDVFGDRVIPNQSEYLIGELDNRFNLRFYNALKQSESNVEIIRENCPSKKNVLYRLEEKILVRIPRTQSFDLKYDSSNDKKIVIVWTENKTFEGLPKAADCYIWIVEKQLPSPDFFKSLKGNKIIVVKGDTLRRQGASISRSLSWEKTANETVWQITQNKLLRDRLLYAQVVVVPFGLEGVILIDNTKPRTEKWENTLWFSLLYMEGDIETNHSGYVPEAFEAFIHGLIQDIKIGLEQDRPLLDSVNYNMNKHLENSIITHICGYHLHVKESRLTLNYDYIADLFSNKDEHQFQPKLSQFKFYSARIPGHETDWLKSLFAAS
jgi:hypothetical protein